jgi:hypothetical protein
VVPVVLLALGVVFIFVGVLRTAPSFNTDFGGVTVKCGSAFQAASLQHGPSTHLEVVGGDTFGNFSVDNAIDKCVSAGKSRVTTAIVLWVFAGLLFIGAGVWAWWTGLFKKLGRRDT